MDPHQHPQNRLASAAKNAYRFIGLIEVPDMAGMTDVRSANDGAPRRVRLRKHKDDLSLRKMQSAVTNGSKILMGVDHRSPWMRRLQDLINYQTVDLGGEDTITSAEKALVRRAAMLTLQLEMMEQRFAENDGEASTKQLDAYQRATGSLRRVLKTLGLARRPRDVSPSLSEYLRTKTIDAEDAEVADAGAEP
jgi:hypothetical protein